MKLKNTNKFKTFCVKCKEITLQYSLSMTPRIGSFKGLSYCPVCKNYNEYEIEEIEIVRE